MLYLFCRESAKNKVQKRDTLNNLDENELKSLLLEQVEKYPLSQVSDMLKFLYQNEFGCEHMAPDEMYSLNMIVEEAKMFSEKQIDGDLFEYIGNGMCRISLRILQQSSLAPDTLNRFFMHTAGQLVRSIEGFEQKAAVLAGLCEQKLLPFESGDMKKKLDECRAAGYPPVRHSPQYRAAYAPSYRVVSKAFCDFLPLFCRIDERRQQEKSVTVAIDGNSAAGKSSLAKLLKSIYACNVFSMDDFFLRPTQRTPGRLAEPGGNIDYERFGEEIIEPLKSGKTFAYAPYDCETEKLSAPVLVVPNPVTIIEGVYSLHLNFISAYDIKVFLSLDKTEQCRRLLARNADLYDSFINEWIPMENHYFDDFKIADKCDFVFDTGVRHVHKDGGIA